MMLYKASKNKRNTILSLLTGVVLMAVGLIWHIKDSGIPDNYSMLLGIFTGLGATFAVFSIIGIFRMIFMPEKLREDEINRKDERTIQVTRAAYAVSNMTAVLLLSAMVFIFTILDYLVPVLVTAGAICVQAAAFWIAYRTFDRKM